MGSYLGCRPRSITRHLEQVVGGGGWDRYVKQKVGEREGGGGGGGLNLHPPPPVRQLTCGGGVPNGEVVSRMNSWGLSCEQCTAAWVRFPVAGQHPWLGAFCLGPLKGHCIASASVESTWCLGPSVVSFRIPFLNYHNHNS